MSKKISQLEEKQELTGNEFVALQDGTDNKKAKVSALTALAGLPAFVLSSDLAGGNGVISSAVWERLTAARTANSPIVVINDNGSLPVANVAILGFGNNEQQQGTTDIIMPARVNDLSDYTVTQTVYQITGSGSTYNIATVTKNLKFYNSGDGTKFLADDGTYKEISAGESVSVVKLEEYFTNTSGSVTSEQYATLKAAIQGGKTLFTYSYADGLRGNLSGSVYTVSDVGNTEYIAFSVIGDSILQNGGNVHSAFSITVNGTDYTYTTAANILPDINWVKRASLTDAVDHGTNDTTFELTPNVFHKWGEVAALTLTLAAETSGVLNEYMFQFTSGTTPTVLTLPETVKWIGESAVEASKTYQVSIVNNLAVLGGA